jgi:DNA adenine methylase
MAQRLQEIGIPQVTPETLKGESDAALLNLHRRLHQLWAHLEAGAALNREELVNAHLFVLEEFKRRGFRHRVASGIDAESQRLRPELLAELQEGRYEAQGLYDLERARAIFDALGDAVLVRGFVSVKEDQTGGIEIWIRCGREDPSLDLKLFRVVHGITDRVPAFGRDLCAPLEGAVPLYDLVLRRKPEFGIRKVEEEAFKNRVYESIAGEGSPIGKILEGAPDFVVVNDFVSLTGSTLYHGPDHEPRDCDLVLKNFSEDELLTKVLSEKMQQAAGGELHFVWEPRGPNWDSVPLYDLVCVRTEPDPMREASDTLRIVSAGRFIPKEYRGKKGNEQADAWSRKIVRFDQTEDGELLEELAGVLIETVRDADLSFDWVTTPPPAPGKDRNPSQRLAQAVAGALAKPYRGVVKRNPDKRTFSVEGTLRGRVLIVDNLLTTGGTARRTAETVRDAGAEPVAVAVLGRTESKRAETFGDKTSRSLTLREEDNLFDELTEGLRRLFGSPGGKGRQLSKILPLIPEHEVYVEPFAGSAAVYFAKEPMEKEVLSDTDPHTYHVLRTAKDITDEEIARLKRFKMEGDEDYFYRIREEPPEGKLERLHWFLYCRHFSVMCMSPTRKSGFSHEKRTLLHKIESLPRIRERMENTVVLNHDAFSVIRRYDGPGTFFFLDPPYSEDEEEAHHLGQGMVDLDELAKVLKGIRGTFLLTIWDTKANRDRFGDFDLRGVTVDKMGGALPGAVKARKELYVCNYGFQRESDLEEGIRPAFGSAGGKKFLARRIVSYIPEHKKYVEPFVGGGAVFFAKKPSESEVLNDKDPDIAHAYRYIRQIDQGKIERLRKMPMDFSRDRFFRIRDSRPTSEVGRFHRFLYLNAYSFGKTMETTVTQEKGVHFGSLSHRIDRFPRIAERLKGASISNADFREVIRRHDGPDTFFYLDPPYPEQQGHLKTNLTNESIRDAVTGLQGKFILSLPYTQDVRETFGEFHLKGVWVRRTLEMKAEHYDRELLVSNFPLKASKVWLAESLREAIRLGTAFVPMKAARGYREAETTRIDELWETWARAYLGEEADPRISVAVETKFDGIRMVIHKKGETVGIFTEDRQRDRAPFLPDVVREVRGLVKGDAVLDAEFVMWKGDKPRARHDMIVMVVGKEPIEGEDIRVNVFDSLWDEGQSIEEKDWRERQASLKKLLPNDGKYLRKVQPIIARDRKEMLDAIEKASAFPGSEGAMLKVTKGPASRYKVEGDTLGWAKFKVTAEVSVMIIGRALKPGGWGVGNHPPAPGEVLSGEEALEAYRRLRKGERTWIYRVAFLEGDRLVSIDAQHRLTSSDLELRWVPKGAKDPLTGQIASHSAWRGTDDPAIWEMGKGFSSRPAGAYAYGNTYASALDPAPEIGQIITMNPVLFQEWKGEDGQTHYSWTFPAVRNAEPAKTEPDSIDVLKRILKIEEERKAIQEQERLPSQVELRKALERRVGDWFMARQKEGEIYLAVHQIHIRGIWSKAKRQEILKDIRELKRLGKREQAQALEAIWKKNDMAHLVMPLQALKNRIQPISDVSGDVSGAIGTALRTEFPGATEFDRLFLRDRIVNQANAHTELRMEAPPEKENLIGWTLDTPGAVLQYLRTGRIEPVLRNKFLQNRRPERGVENVLTQKKSPQPLAWLTLVGPDRAEFEAEPGLVGATERTAGLFRFVTGGPAKNFRVVYGAQKSDYHELFLFYDDRVLQDRIGGRWGFQLIEAKRELAKAPEKQFWTANRPKDQQPYIFTHDYEEEVKKAKADGLDMIWNHGTISTLERLGYFRGALKEALEQWKRSPRGKRPEREEVSFRPRGEQAEAPSIFSEAGSSLAAHPAA